VLSAGRIVLQELTEGMDVVRLEAAFLDAVRAQGNGGDDIEADELMVSA
jgi:hypothetical protein